MNTLAMRAAPDPRKSICSISEICCASNAPASLAAWLQDIDLDQLLDSQSILHAKDRCVVALCTYENETLLLKRHVWGGRFRTLTKCFRVPVAEKCWIIGQMFAKAELPTPRALAYVNHKTAWVNTRSYLLSEFVPGKSLYDVLRHDSLSEDRLSSLARQLAGLLLQLESLQATHNDLKPENLIVDPQGKLWLIDLEMARFIPDKSERQQRHLADISRVLHPRSWRSRPEAHALFLNTMRQAVLGQQLHAAANADHIIRSEGLSRHVLQSGLSVVVRCEGLPGGSLPQQTLDSVANMADEILLVYPQADSQAFRWDANEQTVQRVSKQEVPTQAWVIRLHESDCVTPELAKAFQECAAKQAGFNGYHVNVLPHDVSRPHGKRSGKGKSEPRLVHRTRTNYCLRNDTFQLESTQCGTLRFPIWRLTGSRQAERNRAA